jgi:hypothetical protein
MFWIALTVLTLAIALWRYSHSRTDEVSKLLTLIGALVSLMMALAIAPLPLKLVSLMVLLVYPACLSGDRIVKPDCPRVCLLRQQCKPPHHSSPF